MISHNNSPAILPATASADGHWPSEIVAAEIAKRREAGPVPACQAQKLPARIMAATSLLTFATLTAGYELFFRTSPFA